LVGNNAEKGSELLNKSGLNLIANTDLEEAAKLVVKHAGVTK
jgi:succinyl-CoA synthetase beta subunit